MSDEKNEEQNSGVPPSETEEDNDDQRNPDDLEGSIGSRISEGLPNVGEYVELKAKIFSVITGEEYKAERAINDFLSESTKDETVIRIIVNIIPVRNSIIVLYYE